MGWGTQAFQRRWCQKPRHSAWPPCSPRLSHLALLLIASTYAWEGFLAIDGWTRGRAKKNHFVVPNIQNLGTQCETRWSEKFPGDCCEKFHQTSLCRDYCLISPLTRDTDWKKKSGQQTLIINQQTCSQKRIARSYKMGGREVNHSDMSSHCSKNWYTDKTVKPTGLGISFPME